MSWLSKKSSQDYGEYLPDEEATLQTEKIHIQANNRKNAEARCKEEAKYDGFDAEIEPKGGKDYDCRFKFWS
ncbi:hypothetical protein [Fortiea contorta]|uniref:hypothetical protein n=1 Tax=Fortiea contorta TaxID=1892405 RepID=UPI00034BD304|nr:hypothetical protein [Fortiea contorta]